MRKEKSRKFSEKFFEKIKKIRIKDMIKKNNRC